MWHGENLLMKEHGKSKETVGSVDGSAQVTSEAVLELELIVT